MKPQVAAAARRILATVRHACSSETYAEVEASAFPHLDLGDYEATGADLLAHGFRHLADLELLEVSNSSTTLIARTMLRVYVSGDGATVAVHYQLKPRLGRLLLALGRGLRNLRLIAAPRFALRSLRTRNCFDFESEFQDGSFLCTSNAETAGHLSSPPTIDHAFFPHKTPLLFLLDSHCRRLGKRLSAKDAAAVRTVDSLEDLRGMQRREKELKNAHRLARQWITREELRAFGGNRDLADAVFKEVRRLIRKEGLAGGAAGK